MYRKYVSTKDLVLSCFFLLLFIFSTVLIFITPASVKITYGLTVQSEDGVTVSFNVFEPRPDLYDAFNSGTQKKAIIIGHGFMANKEIMKGYALELAAAGFVAVPFDFRGHGQSTGTLGENLMNRNLINDVRAIQAYLEDRGDIDMDNLGYIGYSMGGGPGNQIVSEDTAFKCFIGIGTGLPTEDYRPEYVVNASSGRTLNVLMIQARFDEAVTLARVKEGMAFRLNVKPEDIDTNKLYGSFEDGNASMIFLDDNTNHLLLAWDQDFIREARNWVISTFPEVRNPDENFYVNTRFIIVALQITGGLGVFFLIAGQLSSIILKNSGENVEVVGVDLPDFSATNVTLQAVIISLVLGLPGMIIFGPVNAFLPLNTIGQVLMLLFGQAFGIFLLTWWLGKKTGVSGLVILKKPFEGKESLLRHVLLGVVLSPILYIILHLSIGLNYYAILPSIAKIIISPVYMAIGFIIFTVFGLFFQAIIQNNLEDNFRGLIKATSITFGVQIQYMVFYLLLLSLAMGSFFTFGVYLPVTIPTTLLASSVSVFLYKKTGNIVAPTMINAFFITLMTCTVSVL
ncbi:MAG: alpha/beta hydrolase [Candidatus Odinarchaeota archaeon]